MIGREKPRTNARRLPPSDRADISGREEMRAASSHDAMEGDDSVLGEALEDIFHPCLFSTPAIPAPTMQTSTWAPVARFGNGGISSDIHGYMVRPSSCFVVGSS